MKEKLIKSEEYKDMIDVSKDGILDYDEQKKYQINSEDKLELDKRFRSLLIPQNCLKKRINHIAFEICNTLENPKCIDLLVVLTGAFMFAADIGRKIFSIGNTEVYFHYVKLSTYDKEIKQTGETKREVKFQLEPSDLEGKEIVIIEDIIDQGFTMNELKKYLIKERNVKSVKICTLLLKKLDNPTKEVIDLRKSFKIDFIGFKVPDVWVAGYGIDAGNDFRYLPFIIDVNEQHYLNS